MNFLLDTYLDVLKVSKRKMILKRLIKLSVHAQWYFLYVWWNITTPVLNMETKLKNDAIYLQDSEIWLYHI